MGAVISRELARWPWWRRALAWAFPRPVGLGTWAWTGLTVAYVVSVAVCAVLEARWLVNFDGTAPIPLATATWTAPTGWLGWTLTDSIEGDGGIVVTWSAMALCGWLQAWAIWRIGMAAVHRLEPEQSGPAAAPSGQS